MKKEQFFKKKMVIGMVHLLPMPGNASYKANGKSAEEKIAHNKEIVEWALKDAQALIDCGVDAIMLENFSDWPQYSTEVPLENYSLMLNIASKIKDMVGDIPFGVNIEMNAWKQEWTMAYAVGADFIRVEAFVDNRAGSFGMIEAASTQLMDIMRQLPSETMLFTDVHTAETYGFPNVPINELCCNARSHESSAIIVTENDENKKITFDNVRSMKEIMGDFPVIVGAGVKEQTVVDYFEAGADAVIVGRGFKDGEHIDPEKVKSFMKVVNDKYGY